MRLILFQNVQKSMEIDQKKAQQTFSHFTAHFNSFTVQSHVQSNHTDVDIIFLIFPRISSP